MKQHEFYRGICSAEAAPFMFAAVTHTFDCFGFCRQCTLKCFFSCTFRFWFLVKTVGRTKIWGSGMDKKSLLNRHLQVFLCSLNNQHFKPLCTGLYCWSIMYMSSGPALLNQPKYIFPSFFPSFLSGLVPVYQMFISETQKDWESASYDMKAETISVSHAVSAWDKRCDSVRWFHFPR